MTGSQVKIWLRAIGRNQNWLASEMSVSYVTISRWLSDERGIPEKYQKFLASLMKGPAEGVDIQIERDFDLKELHAAQLETAAAAVNMKPEEFLSRLVIGFVNSHLALMYERSSGDGQVTGLAYQRLKQELHNNDDEELLAAEDEC